MGAQFQTNVKRIAALAAFAVGLSGCTAENLTPEVVELANIRHSMIFAKSSPKRLIETFERVCLAEDIGAARAELRSLSYAKSPGRPSDTGGSYFSDNTRPAVIIRPAAGGYDCLLQTNARTGQANAVDQFMAKRFPQAKLRPTDGFERFWVTPYRNGGNVVTKREGTRPRTPRMYNFGILRPVALNQPTPTSALEE